MRNGSNFFVKNEGIYEYVYSGTQLLYQLCITCKTPVGIIPGSRDAICNNCGYKDPCCE